ncbi:hypothetical protein GXW78_19365 [Roseomonas terrae]|jgi:hypothetical protein|uniref:Uncharacterized protein n=1 Tax=Neoroseomonas terrae TaxID=424799 RepID=A0ABS5ELC1_9PROT|nr:hypothetical protein [Neoroseomonas terrae]MBR0651838.1 hypothetical protein [Neoroseomonas terrae]
MPATDPKAFIERAMLDPPSVFATPEAVLAEDRLSKQQKIEILRRWMNDAASVSVAVEEGMPGNEDALARRVVLALQQIAGPLDLEHSGPNKQRGLPRDAVEPDGG